MPAPAAVSKASRSEAREHHSSRNTSPLSSPTEASPTPSPAVGETAYLQTPLSSLLVPDNSLIESIIEKAGAVSNTPPSAASLNTVHDGIREQILGHVAARGTACDRSMRGLARKRKERIEAERERDEMQRMEEEKQKREVKKLTGKKREREEEDETRPPAVGAHGLARQDGVDVHMDPAPPSSPAAQVAQSTIAIQNAGQRSPSSASETSHQPPPALPVAQYQTFGDDPTQFDDPTIYDIGEITPDMTDDEKKAILCVADYPHDDLHELTPGTPPDHDFSNAKPSNQVAYATFQAYVEPYVRPLTEEDVAFLKERGDRVEPFLMPNRGPMPYREVWARDDGLNPRDPIDHHLPQNEARGSIEEMNDEVSTTDEVSAGPLLARLLSTFRQESNTSSGGDTNELTTNGDTSMINGAGTAGDMDGDTITVGAAHGDESTFRPSTFFSELATSQGVKPPAPVNRNFASMDQRLLQELRYHGILTPEASPDYDGHFDDEVAARLRYLQSELQTVASENGARKARVLELTEERMAMQEYSTIADDLDSQINTAYLKRNRTMSKPRKGAGKPRPGQAGASGVALSRNLVSEGVRMLMERRAQWKDLIGPVVEFGQKGLPEETVFDAQTMSRLAKVEGEIGGDADGD